jgi:hypothetical protein
MDETRNHNNRRMRVQVFAGLMVTAFAVTLAVAIANRLSDEALAVLAGVVCGVGAAIPTSLLVVAVTRRQDARHGQPGMYQQTHPPYPPVVVVTPQNGQQWPGDWNNHPPVLDTPTQRRFVVVGGTPAETEVPLHKQQYP